MGSTLFREFFKSYIKTYVSALATVTTAIAPSHNMSLNGYPSDIEKYIRKFQIVFENNFHISFDYDE